MSYMTIMQVDDDGDVVSTDREFQDSGLFYVLTWKVLAEKYLDLSGPWDDPFGRLWAAVGSGSVAVLPEEYNVLIATYDRVLFRAEDVLILAESMGRFGDLYPDRDGHWHDIGRALVEMTRAVGFEMSITDQWTAAGSHDESTGDYTPYSILTGDLHWWAEVRGA